MSTSIMILALSSSLLLLACSNNETSTSTVNEAVQVQEEAPALLNTIQNDSPATEVSQETTVPVQVQTQSQVATPQTNAQVKLNPEHGQPGHRCDIPVGAPLDGTPAQAAPAVQPNIVAQPGTNTTANTSTSPTNTNGPRLNVNPAPASTTPGTGTAKLNPEHGQPGHRCDIQVGAPLPN